jgi:DNA-binding NarL/FixJ family response regulator
MIQIAVVEDIQDIRESMVSLFQGTEGFLCVYSFENAEDTIASLTEDPVDVVLMDIHLPGMTGTDCVKRLKIVHPNMQFVMCTIFQDDENIFNALKAGATGYLLKGDEPEKIIQAIQVAHTGGAPMNSQIARRVIQTFHQSTGNATKEIQVLTAREQELLRLLSKGYRYKEIADQLTISIETVRKHISNIYSKLQVQSRMEAVNKVFGVKESE